MKTDVPFKLFVGNIPENIDDDCLFKLFGNFGTVVLCNIIKDYGFVHMATEKEALKAALKLNGSLFGQNFIAVRPAKRRLVSNKRITKFFVFNLVSNSESVRTSLRELFKPYGIVYECSIVRKYAFVHMDCHKEAKEIINNLQGKYIDGRPIFIQLSKNSGSYKRGHADSKQCYRCGEYGHWRYNCPYGINELDTIRRVDGTHAAKTKSQIPKTFKDAEMSGWFQRNPEQGPMKNVRVGARYGNHYCTQFSPQMAKPLPWSSHTTPVFTFNA